MNNLIKKLLYNKVINYVFFQYFTYFLNFVNSILLAYYLGPYNLGIWGFINLVLSYTAQFNFGIPYSINNIISINKDNRELCKEIIGGGFFLILCLCILIISFFAIIFLLKVQVGTKYNFSTYIIPIIIISCFTQVNSLFSNIYRIYGKIMAIIINQTLFPILLFISILIFKGDNLLMAAIISNCISFTISLILYIFLSPVKIRIEFDNKNIKFILKKGWYLFVYTASFYLILITTRSFVSSNYGVSEFGLFTFSFSLANAMLLLLNSVSFLILPKMLNRFSKLANEQIQDLLKYTRAGYITLSHVIIHFVIFFYPVFIYFFPAYKETSYLFRLIALTVALYTNSFGYQVLITSRQKEKELSEIGFFSLILNVIFLFILIKVLKVPFEWAISATLITYFIYSFIIGYYGKKQLSSKTDFFSVLLDIYPIGICIPFITSLFLNIINASHYLFIIPIILIIILNNEDIQKIKFIIFKVINNPKFIDL